MKQRGIYAAHNLLHTLTTEDNNICSIYIIVLCLELSCVGSHAWAFMYGFLCMGSHAWVLVCGLLGMGKCLVKNLPPNQVNFKQIYTIAGQSIF